MSIDVNKPPAEQCGRCPRCAKMRLWVGANVALNALCRDDNKTYICSPCGSEQSLVQFFGRWRAQA